MSLKRNREIAFAAGFPIVDETSTISAVTLTSTELALEEPCFYRIHFEVECWFCTGPTGVSATETNAAKAPAGMIEYFGVCDSTNTILSVRATGAAGNVYITKMKAASDGSNDWIR